MSPTAKWSSESHKGLTICRAKAVPLFFSYFKTLSICQALGSQALYRKCKNISFSTGKP